MDSAVRRAKIQSLKTQLELCRLQGIAFAKEYEAATTDEERIEVAARWDRVLNEGYSIQDAIGLLEKQQEAQPQ